MAMEMTSQRVIGFPDGVERLGYRSLVDQHEDWALAWPGRRPIWVVVIHGHGSTGDQIFTRGDISTQWLPVFRDLGLGVLAPNLRGNAWMGPAALHDLHELIAWVRHRHAAEGFWMFSGSMGGTGNLIYAARHAADIRGLVALCPATDLTSYHGWLVGRENAPLPDIRRAIESAYGGLPTQQPQRFRQHSALLNAQHLTMPIFLEHGENDAVIPVSGARALAERLAGTPAFTYHEIAGGDHEAPINGGAIAWLRRQLV
jgi:pimeloyl-ACP methyl ester carboxylesterase